MGRAGEPVAEGDTGLPECPMSIPTSDTFREGLGLQWQWQANPDPAWYQAMKPGLRLYAAPADTLFEAGQFLSQLMQSYDFDMETSVRFAPQAGDACGIGMIGYPYHYLCLEDGRIRLIRGDITEYSRSIPERIRETVLAEAPAGGEEIRIRMRVRAGEMRFGYALPGEVWQEIGDACPMAAGGWTAARPGIFCLNRSGVWGGYADFLYARFTEVKD